ncbi:hypothetical protein [Gilliamella apis]|uniref:hypothetical protein n=1 Tax=Gilliamella apis TaxID=1970738 RepID=UPI0027409EC8|nr:hypothetical protein [Gilliamella apis]WLT05916.1 hypothetical protein RAM11_08585 [Gilliamella apis]
MVKNNRDLMEQVILDCFTGLHDLEPSIPERICHYILYGKDPMVLDDLNKLTKSNTSNEYDKQVYSLLGCPILFFLLILMTVINHSKIKSFTNNIMMV